MRPKSPHVLELLDGATLCGIDVGARSDIPPHWLELDGIARFVAFEPDPAACERLRAVYDARGHGHLYTNLPIALSGGGGPRTLYVTNTPSGSSLLSPDTPIGRAYVDHGYLFPVHERTVATRTLREVIDELGEPTADLIKLDIQGAELEVLRGFGEPRLAQLYAIEVEACIEEQYRDEPTFFDIQRYLTERGFELLDLRTMRVQRVRDGRADGYTREIFGVHAESPTLSARLLDVDGLYFRRPAEVLARRDPAAVRKLATIYCVYGFFCEAHHLIEQAAEEKILDQAAAQRALAAIVAWHHQASFRRRFHSPSRFWHLMRLATKSVGMSDRIIDELVRGRASDVVRTVWQRANEAWRS